MERRFQMDKEIIYYNSEKAAQPAKLILADGTESELWVSSKGRGYREEHTARYDGCTHRQCECGSWVEKGWTKCDKCRSKASTERYYAMPSKPYDEGPVVLYSDDTYFWSIDDILDYCHENEVKKEELQLVHCVPTSIPEVDWDYFSDVIPIDGDEDVFSKEMEDALNNLNKIIREHKPVSWTEGKYRVTFEKEVSDV